MCVSLDPQAPFFVNYLGKAFGAMKRNKGSILEEYGKVTGVEAPTTTGIRRTVESHVQSDHNMRTRSKAITQHSAAVGDKHYHKVAPEIRAAALHRINQVERIEIKSQEPLSKEVAAKRARLNAGDFETAAANAREVLRKSKRNENIKVGARCKVAPSHRSYLQSVFGAGGELSGVFDITKPVPGWSFSDLTKFVMIFLII